MLFYLAQIPYQNPWCVISGRCVSWWVPASIISKVSYCLEVFVWKLRKFQINLAILVGSSQARLWACPKCTEVTDQQNSLKSVKWLTWSFTCSSMLIRSYGLLVFAMVSPSTNCQSVCFGTFELMYPSFYWTKLNF